jgi:hypothetical protein
MCRAGENGQAFCHAPHPTSTSANPAALTTIRTSSPCRRSRSRSGSLILAMRLHLAIAVTLTKTANPSATKTSLPRMGASCLSWRPALISNGFAGRNTAFEKRFHTPASHALAKRARNVSTICVAEGFYIPAVPAVSQYSRGGIPYKMGYRAGVPGCCFWRSHSLRNVSSRSAI